MHVLGIETSCDETSVAVWSPERGLRSMRVLSQMTHRAYGGVVPEIAAREHVNVIEVMTREVLEEAGITPEAIGLVAATRGPGLIGALLVGHTFGKSLAGLLGKPFIGVHHLEGHLYSPLLNRPDLAPPFLALLISGGHTELLLVRDWFVYTLLGYTLDDAVGEAFDKVAKLLGLPYPGGPEIDRMSRGVDPGDLRFPLPQTPPFHFSFSGLKTAVRYYVERMSPEAVEAERPRIAAAFQEAAVDQLLDRLQAAHRAYPTPRVVVAGGVALNTRLREKLSGWGKENNVEIFLPEPRFCADNAAMIALAGWLRFSRRGETSPLSESPRPSWPLPYEEVGDGSLPASEGSGSRSVREHSAGI